MAVGTTALRTQRLLFCGSDCAGVAIGRQDAGATEKVSASMGSDNAGAALGRLEAGATISPLPPPQAGWKPAVQGED
ncbi:MAG TPA: hypothetical protein VF099_14000 [Ktedonobacterales bacterium]